MIEVGELLHTYIAAGMISFIIFLLILQFSDRKNTQKNSD